MARKKTRKADQTDPGALELFSAAALTGYISAQGRLPNKRDACRWSLKMGALMARSADRLRRRGK
jgi:hypothetical protein